MVWVLPVHFLGCPNRRLIKFICFCFIFKKRKQKKQIQQHDVTSTDRFECGFCLPLINQKTLQIHDKCIIQSMQQLTQSQPWDRATGGSTTRALIATLPATPSRSSPLSLSLSRLSVQWNSVKCWTVANVNNRCMFRSDPLWTLAVFVDLADDDHSQSRPVA